MAWCYECVCEWECVYVCGWVYRCVWQLPPTLFHSYCLTVLHSPYRMDESFRPVRLRKVVLGYPCSENITGFRFDLTLSYKLARVIQTYSEEKPTLVVWVSFFNILGHILSADNCRYWLDYDYPRNFQWHLHCLENAVMISVLITEIICCIGWTPSKITLTDYFFSISDMYLMNLMKLLQTNICK